MEFHDEYDITTKRIHLNLVFKTGFKEFNNCVIDLNFSDKWYVMLYFLNRYDTRMKKLLKNNDCYSKLWTGVVPWD